MTQNLSPLVSIIINNFNYGRFLKQAIDSALTQSYSPCEVIVVDDGSTDNSRDIINSYGEQIQGILKTNGGQGSALNQGFIASQGKIICFLDADDTFRIDKVRNCVTFLQKKILINPLVLMYHPLGVMDINGRSLGYENPGYINLKAPPNSYQEACRYRFVNHFSSPTSGLVMTRALGLKVFPLPETTTRISADTFLSVAASLIGEMYGYETVLSNYRIHGTNYWHSSMKVHQKDFYLNLDQFLNQKLIENWKKPVISYFDSMASAVYYKSRESNIELLKLAWRVILWYGDLKTLQFFIYVHQICLKNGLKSLMGIKRPSL